MKIGGFRFSSSKYEFYVGGLLDSNLFINKGVYLLAIEGVYVWFNS